MKQEKLSYTVEEAAPLVGKTEKALRVAISREKFPHRRSGRSVLILRSDLERFLHALPGISTDEALAKLRGE